MPPKSRRQKRYEQQLRNVQMRNRIAAVIGLLAIAATLFFVWYILPESKPRIFVSLGYIQHTGDQAIPFAPESCRQLKAVFDDSMFCDVEDIQSIDELDSELPIDSEMTTNDIFIVYFNGHIVDQASRPTQRGELPGTSDTSPENQDVYWIGPETSNVERSLDSVLTTIGQSRAKLKILLLDAGQFSWSPRFPGRAANRFQSRLAEKLKVNQLGLDEDLWVITSHSDLEISQVSTPLNGSLFSVAVEESIKSLRTDGGDLELDVEDWFADILSRTQSYSRNFAGQSVQHPVLMKVGTGVVRDQSGIVDSSASADPVVFTWKDLPEEDSTEKDPPPTSYAWTEFSQRGSQFADFILDPQSLAALPYQSAQRLELFLQFGDESTTWSSSAQQQKDNYQTAFLDPDQPDHPTDFNEKQLKEKRTQLAAFYRKLFEFGIWQRFRSEMRFFGDDSAYQLLTENPVPQTVRQPLSMTDQQLATSPAAVGNNQVPVDSWSIRGFKRIYSELVDRVRDQRVNEQDPVLTPYQAELLGVLSQRYLPLIEATLEPDVEGGETTDSSASSADNQTRQFQLNLVPDSNVRPYSPGGSSYDQLVTDAIDETRPMASFRSASDSEMAYRYYLVARGTGGVVPREARVPGIGWTDLDPEITLSSQAVNDNFKVPPFSVKPVSLRLETRAVQGVELTLSATGDVPEGFEYGFNKQFAKEIPIRNLTESAGPFESQDSVDLRFYYPNPDESVIGKKYNFQIQARSWSPDAEAAKIDRQYAFSVELTEDAEFRLSSRRLLGNQKEQRTDSPLYRWTTPLAELDWQPLELLTFANVKSPFEFQLQNNSEFNKKFLVQVYRIEPSFETREMRIDRDNQQLASDYIQLLKQETERTGDRVFQDSDRFTLLAETTVDATADRRPQTLSFALPKPADPKDAPPADAEPVSMELSQGLLMVFYTQGEERPEGKLRQPDWFQLVHFRPEMPANAAASQRNLKVRQGIAQVFGEDQIRQLPQMLPTNVNPDRAAVLTEIAPESFLENRHMTDVIALDKIVMGSDQLSRQFEGQAYLMVELLGVPQYLRYRSQGADNVAAGFDLAGVRVSKHPESWAVYPDSWSFTTEPVDPEFEWLAAGRGEEQLIFVRIPPEDAAGDLELEFILPTGEFDILSPREQDFRRLWRGGPQTFEFPMQRKHFLEVTSNGISAWTQVDLHRESFRNLAGQPLQLERLSDGEVLGRWRFVTESLKRDPRLRNVPDTVERLNSEFGREEIVVDVSQIKPPIAASEIKLFWADIELDQIDKLLQPSEEPGQYRVSLMSLARAANVSLDKLKPGSRIELKVIVKDFFGVSTFDEDAFEVIEPKKIEIPKPPEPARLVIQLAGSGGDIKLHSVSSVTINGVTIPVGRPASFLGRDIKANVNPAAKTIEVLNLPPNKLRVKVAVSAYPQGQAQRRTMESGTSEIELKSGDNEMQLTVE